MRGDIKIARLLLFFAAFAGVMLSLCVRLVSGVFSSGEISGGNCVSCLSLRGVTNCSYVGESHSRSFSMVISRISPFVSLSLSLSLSSHDLLCARSNNCAAIADVSTAFADSLSLSLSNSLSVSKNNLLNSRCFNVNFGRFLLS